MPQVVRITADGRKQLWDFNRFHIVNVLAKEKTMDNFKNILVPLDFSDISIHALHSAEALARLFDARITPFHSYVPVNELDTPYSFDHSTTPVDDYTQIEESISGKLSEIARVEVDPQYLAKPLVSLGNPAQAIVEESKEYDLVVMNTHGRTGFTRLFLGSVSEKVLRMSHTPVLIVNKEREISSLDRILITTDFSDHSKEAFPYAKIIAEKAGASVELVHILSLDTQDSEQPEESVLSLREQRLKIMAKEELHDIGERVETKVIISSDTAHEAIYNYNLDNPHDLIIMSTVGRTGIEYLMMGSTTANVVRHVKSAVLSVNPKSKEDIESQD